MKQSPPYQAVDFSLVGSDDERHSLGDYKGSWLVLYFYPKDDTPGCTVEACSLRDSHNALTSLGATVIGISMDTPNEHKSFQKKYNLPFMLLSDPIGETIRSYGSWGKKMFGNEGILRKTFVIDPDGIVQKVYGKVTPLGHGDQIARDIKELQLLR